MKRRNECWVLSRLAGLLVPMVLMCASVASVSCRMTPEGVVSVSSDVNDPKMTGFSQESKDTLVLVFSEEVELSSLEVRKGDKENQGDIVISASEMKLGIQSKGRESLVAADGEEAVSMESQVVEARIQFSGTAKLEAGETYILSGVAHDQEGNSLLFQVPFYGYNDDVAGLVLSEVRSGYDKPKVEYVELYVHRSGNLAGISLYFTNKDFEYVFPSAKVSAGDYIVLHMRALEGETGRVDEVGDDLNASTASDSCSDARDFWAPSTSRIVGTNDVIVLRERQNGKVVDALLYAQSGISDAVAKRLIPVAQQMVDEGVWSGSVDFSTWASGEDLSNTATTRSLSRQNIAAVVDAEKAESPVLVGSSTDWMVVKGATPGQANSTDKYVAKTK